MTAGDEEDVEPVGPGAGAPARPRLQRTTTMLAYRKEPLLVSQQNAAEAAVVAAATPRPGAAKPGLPSLAEEEGEEAVLTPEAAAAEREAANAWAVGGTCEARYWSSPGAWPGGAGGAPCSIPGRRLLKECSRPPDPAPPHLLTASLPVPGDGGFKLRGPSYLQDKKKVKAEPPMFELVRFERAGGGGG